MNFRVFGIDLHSFRIIKGSLYFRKLRKAEVFCECRILLLLLLMEETDIYSVLKSGDEV